MSPRSIAHARYLLGTERDARRAARALRRRAEAAATASEAARAAFEAREGPMGIRAHQVPSEVVGFLELVRAARPRTVLEIGTGAGGVLYLLAWASAPGASLLSLDLQQYPPARRRLYRSFAPGPRRVDAWKADSHLDATRAAVERYFRGEPLDLLFVDGNHGYESVRRDWELYAPLVREGGLIALHDIVDGPEESVGEVPRFWREVRPALVDPVELVESWDQGGYGIGVGRRGGAHAGATSPSKNERHRGSWPS